MFIEETIRREFHGTIPDDTKLDHSDLLHGFVFAWSEGPDDVLSVKELWKKLESYRAMGLCPMIDSYNILLHVAIKWGLTDAHGFADHVLWTLQHDTHNIVLPDRITFHIALNAWAKSGASDSLERAEDIFKTMKDLAAHHGREDLVPNQMTINTLITACAHTSQPGAPFRAEELLLESPNPDYVTHSAVMNAWANSDAPDAPDRCNRAFRHMQRLYKDEGDETKPDTVSYGTLISAYARKGRVKEAETILKEQIDAYERTMANCLFPSRIVFNAMIDAYAKSGEKGAAQMAESYLIKMQKLAEERMDDNLFPNVISYSTVLHAYARSNEPDAATRAEEILKEMIRLDGLGVPNVKPSIHSYSNVMACWAHKRSEEGAARAELLLREMIMKANSGEEEIRPNTICFVTVIDAVVKSRAKDAPERAEALLAEMEHLSTKKIYDIEVNQHCFSAVITAWSQSQCEEAVGRAEELIERMKQMARSGRPDLQPTVFTYSTLLATYAKNGKAKKAEDLLNLLCDDFITGRSTMKPDVVAFAIVISAWAKSSEHKVGKKVDRLYARMIEVGEHPDVSTFTMLISAWAKGGSPQGLEKAEFYLSELKRHYAAGQCSCKPNRMVYTATLNAWAQYRHHPGAFSRMAAIIDEMIEQDASGNHDCRPTAYSYNAIISSIGKSDLTNKAGKALQVLAEMDERKIPPTRTTFKGILKACAYSSEYSQPVRNRAYEIAQRILERASLGPEKLDRDIFCLFFEAANGVGKEHELEAAYRLCCQEGFQHDAKVLQVLQQAAPHLIKSE